LVHAALSAEAKDIYVWVDGAKTGEISQIQKTLLVELDEIKAACPDVRITVFRPTINFGAAASVMAACSILFSKVSKGIILEDDLEVDKDFFDTLANGIDMLKLDSDVWLVSGSRILETEENGDWDLLNYPVGWGWGTTSDKWATIMKTLPRSESLKKIKKVKRRGFWKTGYSRATKGFTDAWDTPLAAIMVAHDKKCLIPPVNLVTNLGFDSYATHTVKSTWPLGLPRKSLPGSKDSAINFERLKPNNMFYEKKIFRIRPHHALSPYYDWILRALRIKKSKKLIPLLTRIELAIRSADEITL
jgi:hypothetical protein